MIDLHLHFDGSLPIDVLQNIAIQQGFNLPKDTIINQCAAPKNCNNLNAYLKCFDLPLKLLQTQEAIETAILGLMLCKKLKWHKYVEIRFAPQLHTRGGLSQRAVVDIVVNAILSNKSACQFKLILCLMRGASHQDNLTTIGLAGEYGGVVVGVDLAGAESVYPTADYKQLFRIATDNKMNITIHAGEASGSESVRAAIDMGAKRIGHGIAIAKDKHLIDMVKRLKIGIEMCPKSNLDTKAVKNIEEYPIKKFLDNKLLVTINTDNLTVSDTDTSSEFLLLKGAGLIDDAGIDKVIANAYAIKFSKD